MATEDLTQTTFLSLKKSVFYDYVGRLQSWMSLLCGYNSLEANGGWSQVLTVALPFVKNFGNDSRR